MLIVDPLLIEESAEMDQDIRKAIKESNEASASAAKAVADLATALKPKDRVHEEHRSLAIWIPTILAVLGAAWGIMRYTISSEITKAFVQPNQNISGLQSNLADLRRDVDRMQIQHSSEVIKAGSGATPGAVADAATQLKNHAVILPRAEVVQTAQYLLKKPDGEGSWSAELAVLGYVSFLNRASPLIAPFIQQGTAPLPNGGMIKYSTPGWIGAERLSHSTDQVAYQYAAQLHRIGEPDSPAPVESGFSRLVMEGGTFTIDGYDLKNITLEGVHIVYNGGPISIDHVIFLNCTFEMPQKKNTKDLVASILDIPTTTFSA